MKKMTCEMCGSTDMIKQDGAFVCQTCGMKYSVEEAKSMMIEGTVDVQGTVKVDNSAFVEKYLANARRAYVKEDWEEVEKYYNMVEQNAPKNIEAVFFSAFGKVMISLQETEYPKRQTYFNVLRNSTSVINEYFEETNEDKEAVLRKINDAIVKLYAANFLFDNWGGSGTQLACSSYTIEWKKSVRTAFLTELKQIKEVHPDLSYIDELIAKNSAESTPGGGGCYVATAVYGSYDCPQVWTLRRYRDNMLAKTWYGRAFIYTYYAISPTLVKWFGHTKWFKNMWKPRLDRMVVNLKAHGVEDTPYQDKKW